MKKNNTYIKVFSNERQATSWMRMKNNACKLANNFKDIFCIVSHDDNFAVVDLMTAIDLNNGYKIEY